MPKTLANLTGSSIGTNGFMEHSNGIIEQWGTIASDGTGIVVATFPRPFPNALLNVQVTAYAGAVDVSDSGGGTWQAAGLNTKTQIRLIADEARPSTFHWRAIGH